MKAPRLSCFQLLRLYPRAWRERYGVEFLELLGRQHVDRHVAIDVLRQAAAEWRPISGVDVLLLPLLISASGSWIGRALSTRGTAPMTVQIFDVTASIVWSLFVLGRASWIMQAAWIQRRASLNGITILPRMSTFTSRLGLATSMVVGICHAWMWPHPVVVASLSFVIGPAYLIATFIGLSRVASLNTTRSPIPLSRKSPARRPLGLES